MRKLFLVLSAVLLQLWPVCAGVFFSDAPFYSCSQVRDRRVNDGKDTAIIPADYPRAKKLFKHLYPKATSVTWMKMPGALMVQFEVDGSRGNAVISEKGSLRYSLHNMPARQLPRPLQQKVDREYPGYSYFNIKEVRDRYHSNYYIVLQNQREFLSLRADEESLDEIRRYKRSGQ